MAVLTIDEAPMANRAVLACVDETARRATGLDVPFGGKCVIMLGDFRQTCPVIRGGTRTEVVAASIKSSPLWPLFSVYRLTQPVRNAMDPEYAAFVDAIGELGSPAQPLSLLPRTDDARFMITTIFPPAVLADPYVSAQRSILAPTNRQIDSYNNSVLRMVQGEMTTFLAADSIKEADVPDSTVTPVAMLDYVSRHPPHGLPPFSLFVKTNAVYRIMRNLSLDRGLVKNARCVVVNVGRRVIVIRLLRDHAGPRPEDNEEILIPRISFTYDIPGSGFTLIRRQFPLAPAYATTFNSCQGLTLDRVGVDLTHPVFSHGQLYTALSRIRRREHGLVCLNRGDDSVLNVVWPEILL